MVVAAVVAAGWGGWCLHRGLVGGGLRNVVLISLDTCRADRLSCYGYPRQSTPNIDSVANEGVLFDLALTPVPLTVPAHSSMLTGTYPPIHGARGNEGFRLAESNVTLAEMLRDAGYETAAFVGGFPLAALFGLNQGFNTYDGQFSESGNKRFYNERRAEEVSRPAMAWLEQHGKKPFFLFLHYYDAHTPYAPPASYAAAYSDDLYAGEIAYTDSAVGQILDKLRRLGLYEDTLIVITGDHGESLGEHGETTHGYFAYQGTMRVPMIVRAPRCVRGRRVAEAVSLVDIVPTVLSLLGLQAPPGIQGADLRRCLAGKSGPVRRHPLYGESLFPTVFGCSPLHTLADDHWKYIRAPRPELYDLGRDPGEKNNLVEREPQAALRLRDQLEDALKDMQAAAGGRASATPGVDRQTRERLRSLGYAGGGAGPAPEFDPEKEDPKDFLPVWARLDDAHLQFAGSRYEEAGRRCAEVVELRPGLFAGHELLGEITLEQGRASEAVAHFSRAVAILTGTNGMSSHAPTALSKYEVSKARDNLGRALAFDGKPELAAAELERALSVDPDSYSALNNLGMVLQGQGRLNEAFVQFQRALAINPDYAEALVNLGVVLQGLGRVDEAIAHYQKVLEVSPDNEDIHNNLGVALRGRGKNEEAEVHFRKALELRPGFADAQYNLGSVLNRKGHLDEAVSHFRKAIAASPGYARAHNDLGAVLQTQGNLTEAGEHYRKALEIRPDYAEAHYNLGDILAREGNPRDAMAHWREAARLRPDNAIFLSRAARVLATTPDDTIRNGVEAVDLAQRAAAMAGGQVPEVLDVLAAAYAEAGRFPEAVETAGQAITLSESQNKSALSAALRSRLELYRAGSAFRDTVSP